MSLLAIWQKSPREVRALSLEAVIAMAGRGGLIDGSDCSREFRAFLGRVDPKMLEDYVSECLEKASRTKSRNGFEGSGLALQDVINEIGRRLGFAVDDGLYQGRTNAIGYDGIWRGGGVELVVEMKTTEAYNIRLDTVERYRTRLIEEGRLSENSSVLFVVGRSETGSLEEQIRGSRYAWSMRVIGAAALVHLMDVTVKADDEAVAAQIRGLLTPVEYTRLDGIVDLVFRVREDVEEPVPDPVADGVSDLGLSAPSPQQESAASTANDETVRRQPSALPAPGTEAFREAAADIVSLRLGRRLIRRRRSLFETAEGDMRVVVAVSKRYPRNYQSYWYAFYDTQKAWLEEAGDAWVALAATDTGAVYLLPAAELVRHLGAMNETNREAHRAYWHIQIRLDVGGFVLVLKDSEVPLSNYRLPSVVGGVEEAD